MTDVLRPAHVFALDVPLPVSPPIVIILAITPVILLVQEIVIGLVQEDVAVTQGTIDNLLVYRCQLTPIHKQVINCTLCYRYILLNKSDNNFLYK